MMTTTNMDAVLETLGSIHTYGGNLEGWAHSPDALDRWAPAGIRSAARTLAERVAAGELDETFAYTLVCLASMGDDWATKEVAGRFRGAVTRLRLVAAIRRHPRAERFGGLASAIASGRFTRPQLELAKKLAAEVDRAA